MKTTKRKRATTAAAEKAKSPTGRAKAAPTPAEPIAAPAIEPVATPTLVLASICSVREAAALKDSLVRLLPMDEVVLDVGNLERIDTASMQLLCAFVRDRAKANRNVTWAGDSVSLRDAARLLGV